MIKIKIRMNKQKKVLAILALVLTCQLNVFAQLAKTQTKPNILIILADDMGYSDIGCYGGEIHTPNIDRLAAGGVKFSQMYNTSKCFPTRASLLTGVYYQRTNPNFQHTATLGEVVRPAGYHTSWSGKINTRI